MAEKIIEDLTDENFQQKISKGVTLVDFHAVWCAPCRMIAPIVEQLAEKMQGKARVAKLDVDKAQQTSSALQITNVPTLILFKDGKEVTRVLGIKSLNDLVHLIQSHT
jgi:thioredoxin 1